MLPSTIEFEFECDDAAAPVLADEIQAGQVLLNLCINARDATGGTGRLRVAVRTLSVRGLTCASCRAAVDGLFTELAVADSGCGIDPQVLDRMFEPFFSTKDTGKGSGMGLSMVHGIVHEHSGHVVVETEPGRGSTFRVLWPALSANVAPVAATAGDQAKQAKRKRLSGRVLLVDDEASVRGCMQELLSGWGLAVTTAADAAQALHAFATADGAFDLVIADQAMPIKTGLTLAVELRAQNKTLPILLCSGYADDATADAAQRCGVQALLRKPIEPAELRLAVEAAMHGSTGSNAA
jgi:CheY-like chemotaxis protein